MAQGKHPGQMRIEIITGYAELAPGTQITRDIITGNIPRNQQAVLQAVKVALHNT